MPVLFINHRELVREDTAERLVLRLTHWLGTFGIVLTAIALVSGLAMVVSDVGMPGIAVAVLCGSLGIWLAQSYRSVAFDVLRHEVLFATHWLSFEKHSTIVQFDEIAAVYLDCREEAIERATLGDFVTEQWIRRKWVIFLALTNKRIATVVGKTTVHRAEQTSVLPAQVAYWENLATRICALTGKMLVRTPFASGSPHTFIEAIEQILQRRLAESHMSGRSVHLRQGSDCGLEIELDGKVYRDLAEIDDITIRELIQAAVDEWQCATGQTA